MPAVFCQELLPLLRARQRALAARPPSCMRRGRRQNRSPPAWLTSHMRRPATSHSGEGDEADVADDADAKVVAEGLTDLDSVAHSAVRDVVGLHCSAHRHPCQQSCVLHAELCAMQRGMHELPNLTRSLSFVLHVIMLWTPGTHLSNIFIQCPNQPASPAALSCLALERHSLVIRRY